MRNKDRLIIIIALLCMVASLGASSYLVTGPFPTVVSGTMGVEPLNNQRIELGLKASPEDLAAMPPEAVFGQVMFGSFRGLMVDVMWARATKLKEDGKFYEAMQLSDWICTMQPRFAQVWAFHAWNMAYNISVATHTERERWMWVKAGIELLRDRGIPMNPNSTQLYKELSWIFLHKIGQFSDDMNWYYKREVAREWHEVLGPPPTGSTQEVLDWFKPIADAYDIFHTANAQDQGAAVDAYTAVYPAVMGQIGQLKAMGYKLDVNTLRLIGRMNDRAASFDAGIWPAGREIYTNESERQLVEWLGSSANPEARDHLMAFLRAHVLVDHYHMDPSFIYELMRGQWLVLDANDPIVQKVGFKNPSQAKPLPMDFRHPATHGLYWAALGVRVSQREKDLDDTARFQILNTDRQVLHAIQALTHNGRVTYDPVTNYYSQMPDARFITAYERAVITARERIGGKYLESDAIKSFMAGHENFLIWSMQLSYVYGDYEQANAIYDRLRNNFAQFNPDREDRYSQPLDQFVLAKVTENMISIDDATQFITGQLTQGLIQGYANGNMEVAGRFEAIARNVHQWYQNKQARETYGTTVRNRMALPTLTQMKADVLQAMLLRPPSNISPLLKARVWHNIPVGLQQRVFDRVRIPLYNEAKQMNLDPARAFPEPAGMDAYRKAHPTTITKPTEGDPDKPQLIAPESR